MNFEWLSEWRTIISLHSIKWSVFVTSAGRVFENCLAEVNSSID